MYRYVPACLLLALVASCADLTSVPRPPVSLSVLEKRQEASTAPGLPGTSAHEVRLMEAVSPKSLLTLHLPDIGGSVRRFQQTGLYKWFTSPELKEELGENAQVWADFNLLEMAAPDGQGGLDIHRLAKALEGELVFSLESLEPGAQGPVPEVRLLAGVTVTGAEQEAAQLLQLVDMAAAAQEGVHVEKGAVGGRAYSRIVGKQPVPWVVELALVDDALLFGLGRETVTAAIERLDDEEKLSLADDAAFRAAMKRCGDPRDAIRLHVALRRIHERYGALLPPEVARVVKALGLDNLRSLVLAVRLEGRDIAVSSLLDSPGGKDCFTQLLAAHSVDLQFLARLPAGTSSFSIFAVDGLKIIQTVRNALPEKMRAEFEQTLARLRKGGVDLETDVFDVFGPRCAIVTVPTDRLEDGPGLDAIWSHLLGTALICEVQDPARAREVLSRLPARTLLARRRPVNAEGIVAQSYRFESAELPPDFALCYALDGDYLVIAPSERTLRRMLRKRSPETAKRFSDMLDGVPDNAVVLSFDDLRRGPGIYLDALTKGLAPSLGAPLPPAQRRRVRRTSMLSRLGPSISYTVADAQGVFSFSRSPTGGFGSIGGLSGLAVIAAIAVPNLHQARVAANEDSAVATLRSIYTAQETFRANTLRDDDGDGIGEFGFLTELLGRRRPGEKRLRNPSPLVSGSFVEDRAGFHRNGYYFRIYLPAEDGAPIGGHEKAARIKNVDGDLAETIMVAIAWPVDKGITGHRSFAVDGDGRLFSCADGPYSGENAPPSDVLCSQKGNLASKPVREGRPTRDGFRWVRIR